MKTALSEMIMGRTVTFSHFIIVVPFPEVMISLLALVAVTYMKIKVKVTVTKLSERRDKKKWIYVTFSKQVVWTICFQFPCE